MLLRDSQVLPIWEGTTNVLALDALRALAGGAALAALQARVDHCLRSVRDAQLAEAGHTALNGLARAEVWLRERQGGRSALELGARRFALTVGRTFGLALLVEHAQWSLDRERDGRARAAALRFARAGVDMIVEDADLNDTFALANDEPAPVPQNETLFE
ncbi:MAG TPA: hypothetical protein VFX76_06145 [Roseiflexaceae bacterium]|nr:hypothetical protein [Roseiflexaceae bacterium]